jgi:hypothetical protein
MQVTKGLAMRGHRQQAVMMGGLVEQLADRACGMQARVNSGLLLFGCGAPWPLPLS